MIDRARFSFVKHATSAAPGCDAMAALRTTHAESSVVRHQTGLRPTTERRYQRSLDRRSALIPRSHV